MHRPSRDCMDAGARSLASTGVGIGAAEVHIQQVCARSACELRGQAYVAAVELLVELARLGPNPKP